MNSVCDLSEQFIEPATSPLVANLSALWANDPALAEALDQIDAADIYAIERSRSGLPTLSVTNAAGRTVLLHSRHQPLDEAQRLTSPIAVEEKMTFYVLGLGLGYHLNLLFERASSEAIFCVFEPDLRMIRTALQHTDLSKLLASRRVMWFYTPDKAELFRRLSPHTAMISLGSEMVPHGPSQQLHGEFFAQARTWIDQFASYCTTSMNTLVHNSRKTAENIAQNVAWYAAMPGIERLKDSRRGQPAVIVSAGPSLRKNKHLLSGIQNRAVMISVQTTLKPLLAMGIEPHFVTSLDYHEICTRFFEGLPKSIRTELIAEPKAAPQIFEMMTGPLAILGNEFAESLLAEMQLRKPTLPSGATVAHLAFYLAEYLGCDPIIFVGQDLGFSDGLCYSPGTSYEDVWQPELSRYCTVEMKQWEQIIRDKPILRKIPDYRGRPMYTEERLFAYLQQFERDFGKSKSRIIDASEGGAFKRGTTVMTLADAIETYCTRDFPQVAASYPPLQWDRLEECRECLLRRCEDAAEIREISELTLPLLEEIRDYIDDQARVNRAITQIDELRARMHVLGRTYDQVMQFTQETEMKRFERDRKLAAAKATGMDRQQRQVQRDVDNVKAVIEAATAFDAWMKRVIEHLNLPASQIKAAA